MLAAVYLPVLGRECAVVVLPDRALCLPNFSHLLIVNKSNTLLLLLYTWIARSRSGSSFTALAPE